MNITVEQVQGAVPVTVLRTQGDLDASNYQELIARARELYNSGTRDILLDMTDTPFMSSAGIVALHAVALLMRNEQPPDPESGWEAFHAIDRDLDSGQQQHVKLLNPQPRVERALEKTGLKQFFEIFTDRETAIAAFR
jgi:anti-anti-sigma regulatory factor